MDDNQERNIATNREIGQLSDEKSPFNTIADKKTPKKKMIFVVITTLLVVIAGGIIGWIISSESHLLKKSQSSKKEIPKLVIANQGKKNDIYPIRINSDYANVQNFQSFEGLVRYEDETKIVPALASSWSNPDELTWEFNLKKNVKFHTGRIMTADDVVYSYEIAKNIGFLGETHLNSISSITIKSPTIIEIKTKYPDPVLLNKLNFMLIVDKMSEGKRASPIYGTGPYTIKPNTTPSEKKIELVAFDKYHEGRPMTRELTFIQRETDDELAQVILDKKVNIAGEITGKKNKKLDKKNIVYRGVPDASVTILVLNTTKPGPLQKVEVRQAIRSAIDIPTLIKESNIPATPVSQLLVKLLPGHNPEINTPKRDLEKAKELLAKAGYPNGLTLELVDGGDTSNIYKSLLPKQLAEAGITIKHRSISDFSTYLDELFSGNIEIGALSYSSDTLDGADVFSATTLQLELYQSEKLENLISEASKTTDTKKRLSLLQDAGVYVNQEVPVIPLFNVSRGWYMDKDYKMKRDMPNSGMGVYFWKAHL